MLIDATKPFPQTVEGDSEVGYMHAYKTFDGLHDALRALGILANKASANGKRVTWINIQPTNGEGDCYAQIGFIGIRVQA